MQEKCTCNDIANQRDAWSIGMVDASPMGTVYAWVKCSRCGAFWKTAAQYKKHITGSWDYHELFENEEINIIRNLSCKIDELDAKIHELQTKKRRLENRRFKVQARRKP